MANYHQISLCETFSDCQNQFIDAPSFFTLLSEYCDINDMIPIKFFNVFYQSLGASHLSTSWLFLSAFISKHLQKIASVLWFF